MTRQSRKIKADRISPVTKVARQIELADARHGEFELVDKSNYTDADTRDTYRSKVRQTLRRTPKIQQLVKRSIIDKREAKACEWYQGAHEQQYVVKLKIANWEAQSPDSDKAFGHWPSKAILGAHETPYEWARASINPAFLPMFENVVLRNRPLGKLAITFRTVARALLAHIEARVELS